MGECNTHIYISIYKYTRVTLSHFHVTLSHYLCHTFMSHKYTSSHKYNLSHKYTLSHKHTLSHIVTNTFDLRYHKLYVYMYIHDTYTWYIYTYIHDTYTWYIYIIYMIYDTYILTYIYYLYAVPCGYRVFRLRVLCIHTFMVM